MLSLDIQERSNLVYHLVIALEAGLKGSRVLLRGSLAHHAADQYSDIDLLWVIPDDEFPVPVERLKEILQQVSPVTSLRIDPEFYFSTKRRLIFVRFEGLPLFWRLDLDVITRSIAGDYTHDEQNPASRGGWEEWSWPESALTSAVSAIKALLRNEPQKAQDMLHRAYQRLDLSYDPVLPFQSQLASLIDRAITLEPHQAEFAGGVKELIAYAFPQ